MQGRLRNEEVGVRVETECHHCRRELTLEIDGEMRVQVEEADAAPVIFTPDVAVFDVDGPSIIDDF